VDTGATNVGLSHALNASIISAAVTIIEYFMGIPLDCLVKTARLDRFAATRSFDPKVRPIRARFRSLARIGRRDLLATVRTLAHREIRGEWEIVAGLRLLFERSRSSHPKKRNHNMSKFPRTAFALALVVPALAFAQTPAEISNGVLTNNRGMTLYTFDKDPKGKSVCNDSCAKNWPPLAAPDIANASGAYTKVSRTDGSKQWAYKGKPLYLWAKDQKAGDRTGDGVGGVWHIAQPS
jgi:predicted lipoprotein with Yx(FWY)xxD motif